MAKKEKNSTANTVIKIIIFIILIIAAVLSVILYKKRTRFIYNTNPAANGNTAGNLQNDGLFCELDGKVYFSNPFDKGRLYCMDSNGDNVTKLNDETVSSINAYGNYLYFSKNNLTGSNSTAAFRGTLFSAMRCNINGKHLTTLCDKYSGKLVMIGNKVYFQKYENNDKNQTLGSVYSVGIDNAGLEEAIDSDINPAGVSGTYFYYTGVTNDHNIYRFNSTGNTSTTFFEGNCYMCIPDGHDLYYIDADDNYKLKKINTTATVKTPETVINQRISTYNIDSNYIYFQVDDEQNGMLCRMKKNDNTDYDIIAEGHYEKINTTSRYIYFYKLKETSDAYRTPANGAVHVEKLSDVFDLSIYKD